MALLSYSETPIQEIHESFLDDAGVRVIVKREDLNHSHVSGNKWWKLKYNLDALHRQGKDTVLTFGGAFSNHIYATAAAAHELKLKSIGVIRGERAVPLNSTLSYAERCGMQLHFVSRERYRQKTSMEVLDELTTKFGDFYLLPEGGTNELAVAGCREFGEKISDVGPVDYICLSVGTGGTLAGIVQGVNGRSEVVGFSSLRGGDFLNNEVRNLVERDPGRWRIETGYHFGGYGKSSPELEKFIEDQKLNQRLPLDRVYTSKMLFGIFDLVQKKYFPRGSTVLAIHTGGMQGNY